MDITCKYDICTELLDLLRVQLGDGSKSKCVVFAPVPVTIPDFNDDLGCGTDAQLKVGHHGYYITSAAKQKRIVLTQLVKKYGLDTVSSVICQGNYVRPTEVSDITHLPYLTQYDWEVAITEDERTVDTLIQYVSKIWSAVHTVYSKYNTKSVDSELHYVTSLQLYDLYPESIPDTRVKRYMDDNNYDSLFVIGIGAELPDGKPHDSRAKDYDDYSTCTVHKGISVTGLNGDLFVRHQSLKDKALELMSCGIRVDTLALMKQMGTDLLQSNRYHEGIIKGQYLQTIGGGLGQERVLMYVLDLDDIRSTYPELD